MDPVRWQRVEAIFNATADLPPGPERDARVRELCASDPSLAADVEALLREDQRLRRQEELVDPHIGMRLDAYAIDHVIGRGGMAAVYSAHRADHAFEQRVAIKVMDLRLSDPAMVAQFRAERQILATLEHPMLTRLLDGGVTAIGEPYLVMEYVEGVPIDRYCDAHRLDLASRVGLFRQVCDAVAFAHGKLVLHRDLKPSNVLVTSLGHPKVVDFGTATLLEPDRMATVSRAPLTPAYASPEQLMGRAVSAATDQYSLGLILYELVTGAMPFGGRTSMISAMERAMDGTRPTAPHTAISPEAALARRSSVSALRRKVNGDLGKIIEKALAHEPDQRYASVALLADDLERWSRGEPVRARPPSVAYRASRFVHKHWISVSVAATLAAALVAATGVAIDQARQSAIQAAIALAESRRTEAVNRFLTGMLSSANPTWVNADAAHEGPLTVRRMLDGASQLLDSHTAVAPAAEAEMRRTLGATYLGLGAFAEARPHLERALALYGERGDARGVAETNAALGLERVQSGDMTGAEPFLRDALAFARAEDALVAPEFRFVVLNDLGGAIMHDRPGDPEAIALLTEAVDVARRGGIPHSGTSVALLHLGTALLRTGHLEAAESRLEEALQLMDDASPDAPERNSVLRELSSLMLVRGDFAAAERFGAEAVAGGARTRPAGHPLQASYKSTWGLALVAAGRLEEGEAQLLDALEAYRAIRPAGHFQLMRPLMGLGIVARLRNRLAESEERLREAWAISRHYPQHRDRAAEIAGELGLTLHALGRSHEAERLLDTSHEIALHAYGAAHPMTKLAAARLEQATN